MKKTKGTRRVLLNKEGRLYLVKNTDQDFHSEFGFFSKADLKKKNKVILSNMGNAFSVFEPYFFDLYRKMKRDAQIISLKDIGLIIAETGIGKDSRVLDAGAGSGALALFLANIVKEMVSYEIRDDFISLVNDNIKMIGLKNYIVKKKNIYEEMDDKNMDVIVLDVPEPWLAIANCSKGLKLGGFLVSYSPSITQTAEFVNSVHSSKEFVHTRTIEVTAKEWDIEGKKVRPKTRQLGHTGFLSFCRRI